MQFEAEWLESNGMGGFICGTLGGELRRKWHGFHIARKPPRDRFRALACLEENLALRPGPMHLTARWSGGRWNLPTPWARFEPWPVPHWVWELEGGGTLHKWIVMERGSQDRYFAVYRLEGNGVPTRIPMAFRAILPTEAADLLPGAKNCEIGGVDGARIYLHSSANLTLLRRAEALGPVTLETEKDCEDVWKEPLFASVELSADLKPGVDFCLCITTEMKASAAEGTQVLSREVARRIGLPKPRLQEEYAALAPKLAHAADQFIVRDGVTGLPTILAGYPWFTDWGRDTMISIPGLCLHTGRRAEARDIITHFLHHLRDGLIPNLFPEAGQEPHYNTVDATLWLVEAFFHAWTAEELHLGHPLWAKLKEIIAAYEKGTNNHIGMDSDGLIAAGTPGTQLTWMDVKVNDEVPTPRHGKPVEIQGLWYNALRQMAAAAERLGDSAYAHHCQRLANRAQASFTSRFVSSGFRHLVDVADRDGAGTQDASLRPNMVLPFALTHNIVPEDKRADVLRAAEHFLVTPRGLRSLAPGLPKYRARYAGNILTRDRSYHQGTVWMWLIGPYIEGVRREAHRVPELAADLPGLIRELVFHFEHEGCLNQASEIFDGNAPHLPRGCFAQAWSVAAIIQALSA